MDERVLGSVVIAVWAGVHLFVDRLKFLDVIPRSRWLSAAGGVSLAYVFVHVLPELGERQRAFADAPSLLGAVEQHVYLLALLGLIVFYSLERIGSASRERSAGAGGDAPIEPGVFGVHLGAFAAYNVLVAYLLLHREMPGGPGLALYASAMGLHFLVVDFGLREHYRSEYVRLGRWVLTMALVMGYAGALAVTVGDRTIAALFGFLSGSVVLNVIKEELPSERKASFLVLPSSAFAFAALLLLSNA